MNESGEGPTVKYYDAANNEIEQLPDDARLLVLCVGYEHISDMADKLRKLECPYFTGTEYRGEARFYVPEARHKEVASALRGRG